MDKQLKHILEQAPDYGAANSFDSRALIRAVNAIHPLGKDRALAAIREYVRLKRSRGSFLDSGNLFLVLRCLFEIPQPPGYMPCMHVGAPYPPEPLDAKLLPRFPLILLDDLPVITVNGYTLAGEAQLVDEHIDYFQKHGTLRKSRMVPMNRPLELLAKIEASSQCLWARSYRAQGWNGKPVIIRAEKRATYGDSSRWARRSIQEQLLRVVKSVYPSGIHNFKNAGWREERNEAEWQKAVKDVSRLPLRWDDTKGDYMIDRR